MAKHLNPLEKEFLIRKFKSNSLIKLSDFCAVNNISDTAFKKWIRQYDEGGLEGLARANAELKDVLPEGLNRTEEAYKREILRLRIENERLKKLCGTSDRGWINGVCSFKAEEFKIVDMLSRDFAIADIFPMMGVSRAGYYKWKKREPSMRDLNREAMVEIVEQIHKDTMIVRSMSRAGKPTDNPANEALNGWIKEELMIDYQINKCRSCDEVKVILESYMDYSPLFYYWI